MKKTVTAIVLLLVIVSAIAYFTKPTDADIMKTVVNRSWRDSVLGKTLLYNSIVYGERLGDEAVMKGVMIEDKIFYKDISLKIHNEMQPLGSAYFRNVYLKEWSDPLLRDVPYSSVFDTATAHAFTR